MVPMGARKVQMMGARTQLDCPCQCHGVTSPQLAALPPEVPTPCTKLQRGARAETASRETARRRIELAARVCTQPGARVCTQPRARVRIEPRASSSCRRRGESHRRQTRQLLDRNSAG